jgi:hypothetical protein
MTLETFSLAQLSLHLLDASTPRLRWDIHATDHGLSISHARVDINIFQFDVQWAVFWPHEPAVDFPTQVQEDEQRTSEVELEKIAGVQVGAADRV